MKKVGLTLALVLAGFLTARAQVTVEITQEQEQFLPSETIPTAVRITNRSGETLSVGEQEDWLTFVVEAQGGGAVPKLSDPAVVGQFRLESSKVAIKHVDLAPCFSLDQPGRYSVVATVRLPGWDHDLTSPPKFFDIIEGAKLWERDFGVPRAGASNTMPELRRYVLQQANYIRGQLRLYLRIQDGTGKTIRVQTIGGLLSFSHPEPQVDKVSDLHVLYQNGPHTFSYTKYNPDGDLLVRQYYEYVAARPRLRLDEQGQIAVAGGVRRLTANDFPPNSPALSDNTPTPAPPAVSAPPNGKPNKH